MEAEVIGCDHAQTEGPAELTKSTGETMKVYTCMACGVLLTIPRGRDETDAA